MFSKQSTSAPQDINIGVPQRSVLGPLLFCIYMNDLRLHLDDRVLRLPYADDLQIYVQVPVDQIQKVIALLTDAAHKVSTWAELNIPSLNFKKTKAIAFGTSHIIRKFKNLGILDNVVNGKGDTVLFVDEVLSLGVILDDTLSWKQQVNYVTKKVNRVLYSLKFIENICSACLLRL